MSETSDLAKEVRKLRGELAILRNEYAQVRGRQDVWAANGLDDLDAGHGFQRYSGGKIMLDQNGMILITQGASRPSIWALDEYSTTPASTYPHATDDSIVDIPSTLADYRRWARYSATKYVLDEVKVENDAGFKGQANFYIANETDTTGIQVLRYEGAPTQRYTLMRGPLILSQETADFTTTLVEGMIWYRTDLFKFRARINGATENLATETYAAPATADYLVGTANAGLSAEIVVGTAPGGELGGTWASPTVDATHSGTPHSDYVPLASANYVDLTDGGATTLHTHAGGSGWTPAITAQVAGYTAVKNDVVLCTGTFTVTLTAAATVATGGIIVVKNVSTGVITVDANLAETIDGALTITLAQYDSVMLITNGSNWFVI